MEEQPLKDFYACTKCQATLSGQGNGSWLYVEAGPCIHEWDEDDHPDRDDSPQTLDIGSGEIPKPGYTMHMDARPLPHIEIISKWQDYDFCEAVLDKVFSNQTLEHLSEADQRVALEKTYKWLKPGAVLELWTPCLDRLAQLAVEGSITWEWFQEVLYGERNYRENTHEWVHTLASLRKMALSCGFEIIHLFEIDGSIQLVARRPFK